MPSCSPGPGCSAVSPPRPVPWARGLVHTPGHAQCPRWNQITAAGPPAGAQGDALMAQWTIVHVAGSTGLGIPEHAH